ncbi:Uma2 family endonuclease [Microcoleus sp. FACHB-68]|uniref:Uma2 family endonuclease n=1 Tax=Microcoleus sp. FACHB-68 TaxID=2692826 RepID=UPI001688A6ED|nr:Uma2 family endonuclease [Microcoleus sp. FACHB-68]MBD1940449.1 Uma2 family endonuclease [Microcoleus sp. FACHB-68]
MFRVKYPVEQSDPPLSPRETLPTMYDLPSENPEEPGLPDEFHDLQPELLRRTFCPRPYFPDLLFAGSDINLYYDVRHQNRYKRPDWFGVVGVPRLYDGHDLRMSYVIWQEGVSPFVVVELLSPGTEKEDLGETERGANQPPGKWEVYERILRIPYYVVFNRYNDQLRAFSLQAGSYQELELSEPKIWMPDIDLGLGLWQGVYEGLDRLWLRWYDAEGNWILTEEEAAQRQAEAAQQQAEAAQRQAEAAQQQLEIERQRAEEAERRAEELAQRLRDLGIEL